MIPEFKIIMDEKFGFGEMFVVSRKKKTFLNLVSDFPIRFLKLGLPVSFYAIS